MEPEQRMSDTNNIAYDKTALVAPATARLLRVSTVDKFMQLSPLQRFEELIAATHFHGYLRAEPIKFDGHDQNYGYLCDIPDCELSAAGRVYLRKTPEGAVRRGEKRDARTGMAATSSSAQPPWAPRHVGLRHRFSSWPAATGRRRNPLRTLR